MEVLKTTNEIMLQKLLHLRCIYLLGLFSPFSETQKPAFVWSGDFISRSPQQNREYSSKVFLGGMPWDITEGESDKSLMLYNYIYHKQSSKSKC